MLRVALTPAAPVHAKVGSMVAYTGQLSFARASSRAGGVKKMFKKAVSGEGVTLMNVTGGGHLYVADDAKNIILLRLAAGESLSVAGNDVLAFEATVQWDVHLTKGAGGVLSGGLASVFLTGPGVAAISCHGDPLALPVGPGREAVADPDAAVAWSGHLKPSLKTAFSARAIIGRSAGETLQMAFASDTPGFVIVQPFEEKPPPPPPSAGGGGAGFMEAAGSFM